MRERGNRERNIEKEKNERKDIYIERGIREGEIKYRKKGTEKKERNTEKKRERKRKEERKSVLLRCKHGRCASREQPRRNHS